MDKGIAHWSKQPFHTFQAYFHKMQYFINNNNNNLLLIRRKYLYEYIQMRK